MQMKTNTQNSHLHKVLIHECLVLHTILMQRRFQPNLWGHRTHDVPNRRHWTERANTGVGIRALQGTTTKGGFHIRPDMESICVFKGVISCFFDWSLCFRLSYDVCFTAKSEPGGVLAPTEIAPQ